MVGYVSTLMRIQSAFEQAGILFLDDEAGGNWRAAAEEASARLVLISRNEAKTIGSSPNNFSRRWDVHDGC
jgi:hypothetical protein